MAALATAEATREIRRGSSGVGNDILAAKLKLVKS